MRYWFTFAAALLFIGLGCLSQHDSRAGSITLLGVGKATGGGGGSWTPASVSTLFWYDADDGATITGTTEATQWNDKSGNGRNLTPLGGSSGFNITAAVQNGKTGLLSQNNGANTVMSSASFTQAQAFTLYAAIKTNTVIDGFAILWDGDNSGSGSRAIAFTRRQDLSDNPSLYAGSATVGFGSALSTSTPYYLTMVFNGASSVGYRNGVASSTLNPGTAGITGGIILGMADVYFLEVFAVAGTGSERASAEAYLSAKWGI